MTNEQQQVKDFMTKFEQETPDKPCIPSLEIRKLRAKLIMEEALETIKALGFGVGIDGGKSIQAKQLHIFHEWADQFVDLIEIADGLADLHYVGYCGTAIACGLDMEPIFTEVHRSNMSKLWTQEEIRILPAEEGSKTMLYQGIEVIVEEVLGLDSAGGYLYLVKNKDGKVIKSPSYSPANLKTIIYGPL